MNTAASAAPHAAPPPPLPPAQAHPLNAHLAGLAHPTGLPASLMFLPPLPQVAAAAAVQPAALPGPSGAAGALPANGDGTAYLPGLTKSGKRRRKHPVAEVKGQWTAEEDERLIR